LIEAPDFLVSRPCRFFLLDIHTILPRLERQINCCGESCLLLGKKFRIVAGCILQIQCYLLWFVGQVKNDEHLLVV